MGYVCKGDGGMGKRFGRSAVLAGVVVCALTSASLASDPIATSGFDNNDEGWLVVSTLGYVGSPTYSSSGGNPGGCIYASDPDQGAWGFAAPAKFLGDVSDAYGTVFSFDISTDNLEGDTGWVGLQGSGMEFVAPFDAPLTTWTWYERSVTLTETAGWIDPDTLLPPTKAQMQDVLSDLTALVITAEFASDADMGGLDNVNLVPEPTMLALVGLGALGLIRRRRSP